MSTAVKFRVRQKPETVFLRDYRKPDFSIRGIELYFDLHEDFTRVRSKMEIRYSGETFPGKRPLVLNGENLKLISVRLNGEVLSERHYKITESAMEIDEVPPEFTLEIETEIEPHKNIALKGLYKSGNVFCTQNESEGFRRITYFLDRPDVMTRFTTTIEAEKSGYPILLSNGNEIERRDLPKGRHAVTWEDPFPKPCYLFALVAGDLARVEDFYITRSGRRVILRIFVDQGNEKKCSFAMESLKRAMKWDEDTFGLEYDLDLYMIVAVDAFNFGAMENKGLNIFNSQNIVADPQSAADQNYLHILGVIGHEYFHNWTGNRVTCRDWFQITLKEGLTIFRDQGFSGDMTSRALRRIEDVRYLKDIQFVEDAGPNSHPIRPDSYMEVNNFYTPTVYQKGAEVIRMIETLIGKEKFKEGMRKYFELYDGHAVTTEDFVHAMELASGMDLTQFKHWYHQEGTPVCRVKSRFNKAKRSFQMIVEQKPAKLMGPGPAKRGHAPLKPFHFPLTVALLDSKGREVQKEKVLQISKPKEIFSFRGLQTRPVPSLLRNFSAPVKLETDLSESDLRFLLAHDTDPVNRYEAGQRLLTQTLLEMIGSRRAGRKLKVSATILEAFGSLLKDGKRDSAFCAEALNPPSETTLNEELKVCDFENAFAARRFFMKALAQRYPKDLLRIYRKLHGRPYSLDPKSMGERSLKNTALRYLMLLEDQTAVRIAYEQFKKSSNMTDTIAALSLLCDTEGPEREEALRSFHERWKKDPLVMNKWFAVQAASIRPDTLIEVKRLEKSPSFDFRNPNKQRALLGVFAANLIRFHEIWGSGYVYLADKILEIDTFNPGAAAKLAACFKKFAHLDAGRKSKMKAQLKRILSAPKLSRDTFEIVSKTYKSGV